MAPKVASIAEHRSLRLRRSFRMINASITVNIVEVWLRMAAEEV